MEKIENQKIRELRMVKVAAEAALSAGEKSISDLTMKADALQDTIPGLQAEVEKLGREKVENLEGVVLGRGNEKALQVVRGKFKDAQDRIVETEELISATLNAKKKAESDLKHLESKMMGANHEFWHYIKTLEMEKAREAAMSLVRRGWAASAMGGVTISFVDLLQAIFPHPAPGDEEIKEALMKEYLG